MRGGLGLALLTAALLTHAPTARADKVRVELGINGMEALTDSWLIYTGSSSLAAPELVVLGNVGAGFEVGGLLRGILEGGNNTLFQYSANLTTMDIGARLRWHWAALSWLHPFVYADGSLAYTDLRFADTRTSTWGGSVNAQAGVEFLSSPIEGVIRIGGALSAGYYWRSDMRGGEDEALGLGTLQLHGPSYRLALTAVF